MSAGEVFLSKEGYEKLNKELDYLKTVRRKEMSKQLEEARAQGDLSENAEYDAAKEAQIFLEERINKLEDKLSRVRIIEDEAIPKDKVYIGAIVLLKDLDCGEELQYTLVGEDEADFSQNKIFIGSPIGRGLLGHKVKDVVEIKVPRGTIRYKILSISR